MQAVQLNTLAVPEKQMQFLETLLQRNLRFEHFQKLHLSAQSNLTNLQNKKGGYCFLTSSIFNEEHATQKGPLQELIRSLHGAGEGVGGTESEQNHEDITESRSRPTLLSSAGRRQTQAVDGGSFKWGT